MSFHLSRKEFAYSSSDKMVYIRKFSLRGPDMVMINTLQGHEGEITCVRWNRVKGKWVTGSEDGTIRIWVSRDKKLPYSVFSDSKSVFSGPTVCSVSSQCVQ